MRVALPTPSSAGCADSMRSSRARAGTLSTVSVAFIALLLLWLGLGSYGLGNNNEGLYAAIAEDMLANGHWLMPHLNGVPYPEKPPFFYHLLALAFSLFGANEWSARLVSAAATTALLLLVFRFLLTTTGRTAARLGTLILGSSAGTVMLARSVMPDALLSLLFAAALLGSFDAWQRQSRKRLVVAFAALALAVLTKGLLALLLFVGIWTIFVVLRWRTDGRSAARFLLQPMPWVALVVIALPWHMAAAQEYPDFAWMYFWNEHVLRFLGQRIPQDTYSGSTLYYLPRVVLLFFPWIVFIPVALRRQAEKPGNGITVFGAVATLCILAFFSAAAAKANYYVALALPFASVWLATRLAEMAEPRRRELVVTAVLTVMMLVAGVWAVTQEVKWATVIARGHWYTVTLSAVLLAIALASAFCVRRGYLSLWLLPAQATITLLALALAVNQTLEAKLSVRKLLRAANEQCSACELMLYRDYESMSAAGFYSEQHVLPVIDSESADLWWGRQWRPGADAFVDSVGVLQAAQAGKRIMVMVTKRDRAQFLGSSMGTYAKLLARRAGTSVYRLTVPRDTEISLPPLP